MRYINVILLLFVRKSTLIAVTRSSCVFPVVRHQQVLLLTSIIVDDNNIGAMVLSIDAHNIIIIDGWKPNDGAPIETVSIDHDDPPFPPPAQKGRFLSGRLGGTNVRSSIST